ncbi:MAG TPA: hypothetical protein VKR58_05860 [Aquella sp.]|nr:hypothetical protein [Aquella sp.]
MNKTLITLLASTAIFSTAIADTSVAQPLNSNTNQTVVVAPAPGSTWSGLGYFNFKANSFAEVIANKWTTISFLGKYSKISLDLSGFAGYDDKYKTAVAGISLGHSWHIANTSAGPIVATMAFAGSGGGQKGTFGFGAIGGISLQF